MNKEFAEKSSWKITFRKTVNFNPTVKSTATSGRSLI